MTIQETITRLRELMKKATNGPWVYRDGPQSILAWNDEMTIADIRGYGYLTGGLKLRQQEALEIMDANGELLTAAVNALPALLDAAEQSQWRPIETAPKDGTTIDLWIDAHGGYRVADVQWSDFDGEWQHYSLPECGHSIELCRLDWQHLATHWMPLPKGPEA